MGAVVSADATVAHEANRISRNPSRYARSARATGQWAGSKWALTTVWVAAIAWIGVGAVIGFPRWWELVVTIGLPFLTLAVLTVLQHTQNHDSNAIELKLDEIIASADGASNAMLRVEQASEDDLRQLQAEFDRRLT
jgi:low affinity Fe/Cu permease